jgi:hypothetical protein
MHFQESGGQKWLRGMDSNHDNQLQRLVSYQLDDPGLVVKTRLYMMPQFQAEGQLGWYDTLNEAVSARRRNVSRRGPGMQARPSQKDKGRALTQGEKQDGHSEAI